MRHSCKQFLLALLVFTGAATGLYAQKKVAASVVLAGEVYTDTLRIEKGKTFVVTLPVRNRAGDDWAITPTPQLCKLTETMLGQVGMLPNQEEPKLYFFKVSAKGTETISFVYKKPKAQEGTTPEQRILHLIVE
ncbi:MAG TPA: hypothetical protein PKD90_12320 [Phnomibacter sp.]|nr:hypothetical protein [Phnomibacter sp.]